MVNRKHSRKPPLQCYRDGALFPFASQLSFPLLLLLLLHARYSAHFSGSMIASIQAITDLEVIQDIERAADIYEAFDATTGPTKEIQVREICQSMLSTLPPPYDPFALPDRLRALGSLKPILIFLRQEIDCISKLLNVTRRVLTDLVDAIDGKIVLNESLRDALDSIYLSKVPTIWLRVSLPSSCP